MNQPRLNPENKQTPGFLKIVLGIFVATEGIPYSANEFVEEARNSSKAAFILSLASFFWLSLVSIIIISIIFFKNSNTLFNVNAVTEVVEILPFENLQYPKWSLQNATLHDECDTGSENISGELTIANLAEIEFRRVKTGNLEITLLSKNEGESVGVVDSGRKPIKVLTDCAAIVLSVDDRSSLTFPIDGNIIVGDGVKESVTRTPLLLSGTVHIADKAVLSQEYFLAEQHNLTIGDEFTIDNQSVQSSGLIFVDSKNAMKISYTGKGSVGKIKKYKTEDISISNSFWTKLYNDETVVLLWILLGALYSFVKVSIRYCIE